MNKNRRDRLRGAIASIGYVKSVIDVVMDEEQESADSLPDNMQDGDRRQKMDDAIEYLEEAIESLSDATDKIMEAIG